ncbi:MAG: DNA methyltransferase [Thermodesulfobium sp.]
MEDKGAQFDLFGKQVKEGRVQRILAEKGVEADKSSEKPSIESTTLWDFPTQSYGKTPKGNNKFQGVTPAFIIYNMVMRYTKEGDLVLDPMCGSGTTLDVCKEENRKAIGFDIHPTRPDIIKNDSRRIPLDDNSVDMVFIDPPYGDNVNYSDDPENIGKLSAETNEFYQELEKVARELYRVLKPGKALGWLIGDQWVKKRFTPVGFKIYQMLTEKVGFEPIDIICVVRRNQSSNTRVWHYRAIKWNFYLRGFKYLFIVRKPVVTGENQPVNIEPREKPRWQKYK